MIIIDQNRSKQKPNQNQNQSNQTKLKQNQTRTMISMAQMEQLLQVFQKNNQKLEQPIQIEKLNY